MKWGTEFLLLLTHHYFTLIAGLPLTGYIRHYEPLNYNNGYLLDQHHRSKRDVHYIISLELHVFDRKLDIRLKPNSEILNKDVKIQTSNDGRYRYDTSHVYTGHVRNQGSSKVHGVISNSGHFEGKIWTSNDTFVIEPAASRYFTEKQPFHSVIYKLSDVIFTPRNNIENRKILKTTATLSNIPRNSHHQQIDENIKYFQQHVRTRRNVAPIKNTCELYIKTDHLFYAEHGGSPDLIINQIVQFIQTVNTIFSAIDFDKDGSPDTVKFSIKRMKIYNNISDPDYSRYLGNLDVINFLENHSEENYDEYCLSYIFTHRDFEDGVLGLAWTASPVETQVGGLCQKYVNVNGKSRSLNTGLVTTLNYGQTVPTVVSHLTLAHEIGHNMGSDHDPANITCAPSGMDGNYIMFAKATSGSETNNQMFSACSVNSMSGIVTSRGTSSTGCFTAETQSICGNKVIDDGEECDCGWEDECGEACCNPRGAPGTPCTLKGNATCSPSHGSCCDENCQLISVSANKICQQNTTCQTESVCDDNYNATCPAPTALPNNTICDGSRVCHNGECTGSICLAYNYEPCQCSPAQPGDWKDEVLCEVCCTVDGQCRSSFIIPSLPNLTMVPGSPCFNNEGYCDVFSKCREVDPNGFFNDLENLLKSSGEEIISWIVRYWWAAALIALGLIIALGIFVHFCCKSPSKERRRKWEEHQEALQRQQRHRQGDGFRMQQPQQRRYPPNNKGVFVHFCCKSPSKERRRKWEEHQEALQRQQQHRQGDGFRMQQPQQRRYPPNNKVAPVFTTTNSHGADIEYYRQKR